MYTVIGSNGFIGRSIVNYLVGNNEPTIMPDINNDQDFNQPYFGVVIYAIGVTANFRAEMDKTIDAHILKLRKALIMTHGKRDKFILLSSTRLYIHNQSTLPNAGIIIHPEVMDDFYNATKVVGESICLSHENTMVLRLSNVLGQNPSASFFSDILQQCKTGHVKILSSIKSSKDYILINDVVDAIIKLSKISFAAGNVFNIAMGKNTSTEDILDELRLFFKFTVDDDRSKIYTYGEVDVEKTKSTIFFNPLPIIGNLSKLIGG